MQVRVVRASELSSTEIGHWDELLTTVPGLQSPFLAPAFVRTVARVRPSVRVAVITSGGHRSFLAFETRARLAARPVAWPMNAAQAVVTADLDGIGPLHRVARSIGLGLVAFDHLVESQAGALTQVTGRDTTPLVELEHGFDHYLEELASRSTLVRRMAAKARRAERALGRLRLVVEETDHRVLDRVLTWKHGQYVRTGARNLLADPGNVELLHRLLDLRDERCRGALSVLYAGSEPIAASMDLRSPEELVAWFPSFAPEAARCSPGSLHFLHLIEELAARGVGRIDMGKGDDAFKAQFQNGAATVVSGRVAAPAFIHPIQAALSARATVRSEARRLRSLVVRGGLEPTA